MTQAKELVMGGPAELPLFEEAIELFINGARADFLGPERCQVRPERIRDPVEHIIRRHRQAPFDPAEVRW